MTTPPQSDTDQTETEADDRPPFTAWLSEHRYGAANTELGAAFTELVDAVARHDKAGELVLKIKISPRGNGQILVRDTVTTKLPEPPATETFYYAEPGRGLSRRDPRQPQLPTSFD